TGCRRRAKGVPPSGRGACGAAAGRPADHLRSGLPGGFPPYIVAVMINDRIAQIGDYPFRRLTQLLGSVQPPADLSPILMSVGEPQLAAPALIAETLAANAQLWGKYPPTPGTPDWRL